MGKSRAWRLSAEAMSLLRAAAQIEAEGQDESDAHRQEVARTAHRWPELITHGMATAPGRLDPAWAEVITQAARGRLAWRVVARQGGSGVAADLSVLPSVGLCLAERRRLSVSAQAVEVLATEDAVTVGIFQPEDIWPTIRRFIPPDPALRADPGPDHPGAEVLRARITPERDDLPPEVLAALAAADSELSIALHADRGPAGAVLAHRHWAVSDGRLLEIRLVDGRVDVVECPAGSVASEVLWLAVGASELLAEAVAS